ATFCRKWAVTIVHKRLYKPSVKAGLKLYNQRKIINEQTKHAGAVVNCMLCLFFYSMIADKISCHFDKINAKKDVFNRFVSYNEGNSDQGKERFKMKIARSEERREGKDES